MRTTATVNADAEGEPGVPLPAANIPVARQLPALVSTVANPFFTHLDEAPPAAQDVQRRQQGIMERLLVSQALASNPIYMRAR